MVSTDGVCFTPVLFSFQGWKGFPWACHLMLLCLSALQDKNESVSASSGHSSFLAIPADRAYRNPQQALTMIAATASAAVQKVRQSQRAPTLMGPLPNGTLSMSLTWHWLT